MMSDDTERLKSRYGVDDTVIDTAIHIAHQLRAAGLTLMADDILSMVNSASRPWSIEWRYMPEMYTIVRFDQDTDKLPHDYLPRCKHWQSPRYAPKRKR